MAGHNETVILNDLDELIAAWIDLMRDEEVNKTDRARLIREYVEQAIREAEKDNV